MITPKKLLLYLGLSLLFLCSCRPPKQPVVKSNWDIYRKAYGFLSKNRDSAFYYFNEVVSVVKDSQQVAMAYTTMGMIQSQAGDDFGAQESLLQSLRYLDEKDSKDHSSLVNDYNELGMTSAKLRNYTAALSFYDRALQTTPDTELKIVILNNKANAYRNLKDYDRALRIYREITRNSGADQAGYARSLTNMAVTRWLQDPHYNAAPELLKALAIRSREKDSWGQNSSYAHLADYYTRSRPDSAFYYARAMYRTALSLGSADDRFGALEKLVALAALQEARMYFSAYRELGDSLQTARNAAKNQFALIRYNVEKEKADNLRLQKDNTEKRYQIGRQRVIIIGVTALLAFGAVFFRYWYRKRKQRLELEAKQAIRENELKTSKKIHDVVANGLYRMMKEVENQRDLDKAALLDHIDLLYEKSRDISYEEEAPPEATGQLAFHERVADLLNSFATAQIRVLSAGNTEQFWEHTNPVQQAELWHILQELMVNMRKHSFAENVAIRFSTEAGKMHIHYTDDGIGIKGALNKGKGLRNTGNRIRDIHGELTFDTGQAKGLRIHLTFPAV